MTKLYQPSNGTEGEWFKSNFCYQCKNYTYDKRIGIDDCELGLLMAAEMNNTDDLDYPDEWCYDENNKPTCTEFVKE